MQTSQLLLLLHCISNVSVVHHPHPHTRRTYASSQQGQHITHSYATITCILKKYKYKFLLYFLSLAASVCSLASFAYQNPNWDYERESECVLLERHRSREWNETMWQGRKSDCCYTLPSMIWQHKIICIINKLFSWIRSRTSNRAQCLQRPIRIYRMCVLLSPLPCVCVLYTHTRPDVCSHSVFIIFSMTSRWSVYYKQTFT